MGKVPELDRLLRWAEKRCDREITHSELKASKEHLRSDLGLDNDPVIMAKHIWGFLGQCCAKDAAVLFDNVEVGNGLEVWRKLNAPIVGITDEERVNMRNKVQAPSPVSKVEDIMNKDDIVNMVGIMKITAKYVLGFVPKITTR